MLLKETFTSHALAQCPSSDQLCRRCHWSTTRVFYFNPSKNKWSKVFARGLSVLYVGEEMRYPVIDGTRTEGKDTLPIAKDLATRSILRNLLLNPPTPPFTLAIAESGQKYTLPWAKEAQEQDNFPVQFELTTVNLNRKEFAHALSIVEKMLSMGFSKDEVLSGHYDSNRIFPVFQEWLPLEEELRLFRGGALLPLVVFVSQRQSDGIQKDQWDTAL